MNMILRRLIKLRCIIVTYLFLLPAISVLLFKVDYIDYVTMKMINPAYDYSYMLVHKRITSPNLQNDPYYWCLIYGGAYIFIWWLLCFSKFFWEKDKGKWG